MTRPILDPFAGSFGCEIWYFNGLLTILKVLINLTIKARNGEVWIIHGLSLKLRIIGKTVRKVIEKFQSKTWVIKFFWIVVMGVFQFVINVQNAPLNGINT